MNATALQLALRDLRARFTTGMTLATLAAIALVMGIAAPFQTETLPLLRRVAYWACVVPMTFGAGFLGSTFVLHLLARHSPVGAVFNTGLRALASTLMVSVALTLFHGLLGFPLPGLVETPAPIAAVLAICLTIEVIGDFASTQLAPIAPVQSQPKVPALLARLPLEKRGDLVAISVADHYIQVTTTKGREMILMRLSDALDLTAPVAGLQIHRSHWVALTHVAKVRRLENSGALWLSNGEQLPISRSRMAAVQAAGLLAK